MTGPTIVWLRRDLRLADNPALRAAVEAGTPVIPVFIWAPEEEAPWAPGGASRWWLHQSLEAFRESLRSRGSDLVIRRGPTCEALVKLADEAGASAIYWNRLYEPLPIARDSELKAMLREHGLEADSFPGNVLFEPWTIRNNSGGPFRVFTAFSKACLKAPPPAKSEPAPKRIHGPSVWPKSLEIAGLDLQPHIDWAGGLRETWRPGEAGAGKLAARFLKHGIDDYASERDRPDHTGTSRLSPYLHFGEISVREIWHAAPPEAEVFRRELLWREFAHHVLFHFPRTQDQPLRPEFARFPWRMNERLFKAWTQGRTGYPLVDAGMRELWHTGWMHNRVRMVVASFLVKHLLIPWREGAAWFWDTLVDADLANNTLGWQWAAGCGADAAPYFRIFNPAIQREKFDPDGAYIKRWIRELERDYPQPVVNHEEARKRALEAFEKIKTARS